MLCHLTKGTWVSGTCKQSQYLLREINECSSILYLISPWQLLSYSVFTVESCDVGDKHQPWRQQPGLCHCLTLGLELTVLNL